MKISKFIKSNVYIVSFFLILLLISFCSDSDNSVTSITDDDVKIPNPKESPKPLEPSFKISNNYLKYTLLSGESPRIYISNFGGSLDFCSISPSLAPTGMKLTSSKVACIIEGTVNPISETVSYELVGNNTNGFDSVFIRLEFKDNSIPPDLVVNTEELIFHKDKTVNPFIFKNQGGIATACLVSPPLPRGLTVTVNSKVDSCQISGIPTVFSNLTTYSFTGKNKSGGSVATLLKIEVKDNKTAPILSSQIVEKVYYAQISISPPLFIQNIRGTAEGCVVDPALPSGIVLEATSGSCRISGTPTVSSNRTVYTITATNSKGESTSDIAITVKDNNAPPSLEDDDNLYTFFFKQTTKKIAISNSGGKPISCEATPSLPIGMYVTPSLESCELVVISPSQISSNVYTITGKNLYGYDSSKLLIQVIEDKNNPIAPDIDDGGWVSLSLYKDEVADGYIFHNTGGGIDSCSITSSGSDPVPQGLSLQKTNSGCILTGTPTSLVTSGSYLISAKNKKGENTLSISITIKENLGVPNIGSTGPVPIYYVGKPIKEYFFANSGGALTSCTSGILVNGVFKKLALPKGIQIVIKNGTCGVTGTPYVVSNKVTYYFSSSNNVGIAVTKPQIGIEVKRADEQSASSLISSTLKYIEGSHGAFRPNQEILIEAGKYYGYAVGNYLSLHVYGPYRYKSNANLNQVNFDNDLYKSYYIPISSYIIPIGSWFIGYQLSMEDEGYYRIFSAFCTSAGKLTDSKKCKGDITTDAKSKVVSIDSSGGGGSTSLTKEDAIRAIKELQSKTSAELLAIEKKLRSTRLDEAIKNLKTRPASVIEGALKNLLDSKPSFSQLRSDYPDVVRILEIFKERYDTLKTKLNLPVVSSDYEKAQVTWEWLFPIRNGDIIRRPNNYNKNVAAGQFPYTFRNFLMATALYPNFCGDTVPSGELSTEQEFKRLCTISLIESFAHFTQEVGAHLGDAVSRYNAPANNTEITADKAGSAGGMKIFDCIDSYYGQSNQYGFKLCDGGTEIPEWRHGLYWVNETGCSESGSGCEYRECALNSWQGQAWPCPEGVKYFGRGSKQLSYNYNYGPFSEVIYGNVHVLLKNPEKVSEGWLSLGSAVSFFMQPRPPKPSMFERIYGFWKLPPKLESIPKHANLKRENFASSIMIINGGVECGGSQAKEQSANRVKYYFGFMDFFGLTPPAAQDADSMTCANTSAFEPRHGAAYDSYYEYKFNLGGCFFVSYETPYSGFFPGSYEKCIRNAVVKDDTQP